VSEIPLSWANADIGDLIALNPKNDCTDDMAAGFVPMHLLGKDYRSSVAYERRFWGEIKKGYTHFADGDVLLAKITPCFENGKAGLVRGMPNGVGAGSTEYFVSRPKPDALDARYLLAFFKTQQFLTAGALQMTGSVGHKRVPKEYLIETEIALAPRNEQTRIADKLDAVLARVDACRDRLDRLPAILKRFRQSVLAAGTSGKLTEDWRAKFSALSTANQYSSSPVGDPFAHTVIAPISWKETSLGDICEFVGGSQPPKSTFVGQSGPDVVRLIQIRDYKSDKHITFIPKKLARRFCSKTDVMIGRYGPPLFQILRGLEGAYNVALMKAQPKTEAFDLEYLYVLLRGDVLLKYVEAGSDRTAGQDGIRKELLFPYPVFLPSLEEQAEIVRRVESLFAFADRLEAHYDAARAQVEKLTPSLLAKAFRGELVSQDPSDEPASVLLEHLHTRRREDTTIKPKRGQKRTSV
jgi:type I restriction enzyme S subunit